MSFQAKLEPEQKLRGRLSAFAVIDKTLSIEGASADAKAVGDAIRTMYENLEPKIKTLTVTIPAAAWVAKTNMVQVHGVTQDNAVILVPTPEGRAEYYSNGVFGASQAVDSITFGCDKTPTVDVFVNVMIFSPGV